jgi:hypothetical protein
MKLSTADHGGKLPFFMSTNIFSWQYILYSVEMCILNGKLSYSRE